MRHLLWGHVEGDGSQVDFLVGLDAGQDEKYSWKRDLLWFVPASGCPKLKR